MIYTVTLNPSIDYIVRLDQISLLVGKESMSVVS